MGALTPVWVVPLSATELPPAARLPASPREAHSGFGRVAEAEPPYPPNRCPTAPPLSAEALLREASAGTGYCRARLVFCPYSQVTGGICTSPPLSGLHRACDPASPCPGVDRPASGLTGVTKPPFRGGPLTGQSRLQDPRFPYAFGVEPLRLATPVNSPARVSRRTGRPWSIPIVLWRRRHFLLGTSTLSGRHSYNRLVSGSFHPAPAVLFSFPSRYLVRYRSRDVFSFGGR